MTAKKLLFDSKALSSSIREMAKAIAADFSDGREFFLVGIQHQGVPLAVRIAAELKKLHKTAVPGFGKLDISMYRDDVGVRSGLPLIKETEIPFNMDGAEVILVDDVLSSGRTIRAALDALNDYGRPARILLAVAVDRGNVEFPIRADYVGMEIKNLPDDRKILVEFAEVDDADGIFEKAWKCRHKPDASGINI